MTKRRGWRSLFLIGFVATTLVAPYAIPGTAGTASGVVTLYRETVITGDGSGGISVLIPERVVLRGSHRTKASRSPHPSIEFITDASIAGFVLLKAPYDNLPEEGGHLWAARFSGCPARCASRDGVVNITSWGSLGKNRTVIEPGQYELRFFADAPSTIRLTFESLPPGLTSIDVPDTGVADLGQPKASWTHLGERTHVATGRRFEVGVDGMTMSLLHLRGKRLSSTNFGFCNYDSGPADPGQPGYGPQCQLFSHTTGSGAYSLMPADRNKREILIAFTYLHHDASEIDPDIDGVRNIGIWATTEGMLDYVNMQSISVDLERL